MKCIFIIGFLAAFASAELHQGWHAWIRQRAECQIEIGLDDETLAKSILGQRVDNDKVKDVAFCLLKKLDGINDKGELNTKLIKEKVTNIFKDKADAVLAKCMVQKGTPRDTALEYILCAKHFPN